MRKRILGWILVAVLITAVPMVYSGDVRETMRNWGIEMRGGFNKKVTLVTADKTWQWSDGNTAVVSAASAVVLTLPAITGAKSGFELTVKRTAGSFITAVYPPSDQIEVTQGTLTGQTSDIEIDAVGDVATWTALHKDYLDGSGNSVWVIKSDKIQ